MIFLDKCLALHYYLGMSNTKNCPQCNTLKPSSSFYRNGRGLSGWCSDCCREKSRKQTASGYFLGLNRKPKSPKLTEIGLVSYEIWANAKKRSLRTSKSFDLDRETVDQMVSDFCKSNHYSLNGKDPFKPSLDRLDNLKGYTKENTRIVWMIQNYAQNTFTDDQVVEFCKRKLNLI